MSDAIDSMMAAHRATQTGKCKYAERRGVFCDLFSSCKTCGWNPKVETKRKEALRHVEPEPVREKWYIGSGAFK